MTTELPLVSAVIAHRSEAEVNLAAFGIIFSLAVIVQAPSTMLLAASTALSRDLPAYRRLRGYMLGIGAALTGLHALLAFTPLYDVVVRGWMAVPPEVVEPARLGLMWMLPWSWGTAYRRFEQGVLIRFGHSGEVVWGSVLRLVVDGSVLALGFWLSGAPGAVIAAAALACGVVSEALYAIWRARPVVRNEVSAARVGERLTLRGFLEFYVPLALTTLLALVVQPLVGAALGRMPGALVSLAVWPVVFGFLTLWQSVGIAYNEAVIALLEAPQAVPQLRRFTWAVAGAITLLFLIMMLTPLATLWLRHVAALSPDLLELARVGLWIGLLLPPLRLLQSWFQGTLVFRHQTRAITESVALFLVVSGLLLAAGTRLSGVPGLYVALVAYLVGFALQTAWLWWRSRPVFETMESDEPPVATERPALVAVPARSKRRSR